MGASARDLTPSLGVTYSQLSLDAPSIDTMNLYQNFYQRNVTFDLKWPICEALDFNIGGGPSIMSYDTWNRTYTLQTVVASPGGGIIGTYGENGASTLHQQLNGYNFNVSLRWYIK
jgi:hypothetical protein